MKKMGAIAVGLLAVFLISSAVYAETKGQHQQRGDGKGESIFKELNVTPEQQKKLEENRKAQREEIAKLRAAMKEKYAKLQEQLKNPAVTKSAVEPLVNEIKSLQARLLDNRISGIFAVKGILTPEQFARFQQMAEKRLENTKERFQNLREKRKGVNQNQELQ